MEDEQIIDLYWSRSEAAITETSNKYGRYCKSIAYRILSDEEDSQECVNDTYLGAWNAMPDQRPGRLAVFLGRITRNIALNRYDYKTAEKRGGEMKGILVELDDCLSTGETLEDRWDQEEVAREISAWLRTLDEDARNAFLRRYWFADSIAEVAERFHMSESKVKSMLFRIRKKLAEHLRKEGIEI